MCVYRVDHDVLVFYKVLSGFWWRKTLPQIPTYGCKKGIVHKSQLRNWPYHLCHTLFWIPQALTFAQIFTAIHELSWLSCRRSWSFMVTLQKFIAFHDHPLMLQIFMILKNKTNKQTKQLQWRIIDASVHKKWRYHWTWLSCQTCWVLLSSASNN